MATLFIKTPALSPEEDDYAINFLDEFLSSTTPQNTPIIIHMAGIPGSGKTTAAHRLLNGEYKNQDFILFDFDSIMNKIPAYRSDAQRDPKMAFMAWEKPAANIGYFLIQQLIANKRNILFDHSGTPDIHRELLSKAREDFGYRTKMYFTSCDVKTAKKRAIAREIATKRHTPEELIDFRASKIDDNIKAYQEIVDEFYTL